MRSFNRVQPLVFIFVLLATLINQVVGLHFDIEASKNGDPFCVRDFVSEGQLVVVEAVSDGSLGDGQELSIVVRDSTGNEYRKKENFAGEIRVAFTASQSTSFDVCFVNTLAGNVKSKGVVKRSIELDIESGSEARDWNKISASEKLKPIELDLRRIEELADEIVDELAYIKNREAKLRDTNESTNARVTNFSFLIIAVLFGIGAWQITYLKSFFKTKHII